MPHSHDNVGDALVAQGQLSDALAAYRASLEIRECLVAQDAGDAGWQRDLWSSYWRMPKIEEDEGRVGAAKTWWRRAYDTLNGTKRRGLFVSPQDESSVWLLAKKLGVLSKFDHSNDEAPPP